MKKVFKLGCFGIIGLFVLIILVGVLASGGDEDTGTTSTSSDKPAKQEEAVKLAAIGETLQVGKVAFTVNGVTTAENVGGQYGQTAQGTYLVIDATVKNAGNEAITIDDSFFKLVAGDKTYEADGTAGVYANENGGFFLEQINPDLSATGKVVFDVSDEVIANPELLLQVQSGVWGTETGQIKIAK